MKRELSNYSVIHNSGQDLWDYLFEGQKLKNFEEVKEDEEWYDESIQWLTDELLDGEIFQVIEDDPGYAITSMGRLVNLKRKLFKSLVIECHSIQGNISGGAVSITRMVKEIWNIDLNYADLPYEVQRGIRKRDRKKTASGKPVGRPRKDSL